jgi:two-component system, NtrC family, C4-dicarboxylate transport sensor histidine kinase DctB
VLQCAEKISQLIDFIILYYSINDLCAIFRANHLGFVPFFAKIISNGMRRFAVSMSRQNALWIIVTLILCLVPIMLLNDHFAARRAVSIETNRAQVSAGLLASGFRRELEKFRLASIVLAQDPDAVDALTTPSTITLQQLNLKLESLAKETNAAAIYLMDQDGLTRAASNWRLDTSFVGSRYDFRAYFRESLAHGAFEQFALGSVSRRPGLYIGRRIDVAGKGVGVIVIKVEFDTLEAEWRKSGNIAFATNRKGIILVTSEPSWRFQMTTQLSADEQRKILNDLEFGNKPLVMNPQFATDDVALAGSADALQKPYIEAVEKLASFWSVHSLAPTAAPVRAAVTSARLILLTLILIVAGIAALLFYRRNAVKLRAEQVIRDRMTVLNDRLVQANKLAALGQIAAGVGHEINQPLTAIATYARNAVTFIAAGKHADAASNMKRIESLSERVGRITGELRGFARKASGVKEAVSIKNAVDGALLLLRDRINSLSATLILPPLDDAVHVIAEDVRLEQVIVNLLQNALDAGGAGAVIAISRQTCDTWFELTVSDNGPGLSPQAKAGLFQPFSTSKADGLGLGLVISRDIMVDFGGELVAGDPPTGAAFTMRLRLAS